MNSRLKPLKDQVFIITGASSGIGLVTARMAAFVAADVSDEVSGGPGKKVTP